MGDVVHALPAAASLKSGFPAAHIAWIIDPKWAPLITGNPSVDEVIEFNRREWGSIRETWRALRSRRFDLAIDFQGLLKSALIATVSRTPAVYGFDATHARERVATLLYSHRVHPRSAHVVDQNIELAEAAGARTAGYDLTLPAGRPEGELPAAPFVLACPLAGWRSKQWPFEHYSELARLLACEGFTLVVNGAPAARMDLERISGAWVNTSDVPGLIHATRQATAVVGVDSGPLHIAAALGKAGVAIFGPTDPARNGPYGGTMQVLRTPGAETSYSRGNEIAPSMRAIAPEAVFEALAAQLRSREGQRAR
jgi:heptosyltransferase-1